MLVYIIVLINDIVLHAECLQDAALGSGLIRKDLLHFLARLSKGD